MNPTDVFRKFVINILLFSFAVAAIGAVLFTGYLKAYYLQVFPYLLVFFIFFNILIFYLLIRASKLRPAKFISTFMMLTGIKLFVYLISLAGYVFADKPHAVPFLIAFLLLYIFYTVFEVMAVLGFLKKVK
jgi:hypothetical protein